MKNVTHVLNYLSSAPGGQTTLNKGEVEFLFGEYSGTVICCGHLREIVATPITDNLFSISTKAISYRECESASQRATRKLMGAGE